VTVEVELEAAASAAADSSQAAYFRAFLVTEREHVAKDLQASRTRLQDCGGGSHVIGLRAKARLRFRVRDLEARKRELERMIAALDCRFSRSVVAPGLDAQLN
jgi:hypothetical protein